MLYEQVSIAHRASVAKHGTVQLPHHQVMVMVVSLAKPGLLNVVVDLLERA